MAITVKHTKVSTIPDGDNADLIRPSDWNEDHVLTGTIPIENGGTGQTTSSAGLNALLPSQTGNSGKVLSTDGTNTSWSSNGSGDVSGPASATDNAIARFDGTTGKLIQNSAVTIADTTGNIAGVGTLSSGAITTTGVLTVTAGSAAAPAVTTIGDTNTGIFFPAADTIAFTEGGTEAMRILSTGSVSFGATGTAYGTTGQVLTSQGNTTPIWSTPTALAGGSNTQIQFNNSGVLSGNATYTMVSGVMKENGFNFVSQADVGSAPNQVPLNQYLGNMAYQDSAGVNITGGSISGNISTTGLNFDSNTLVIDATNNRVGVGTASPVSDLSFADTAGTAGTANKISLFQIAGDPFYGFGISPTQLNYVTGGNHVFYYRQGGTSTERMRIHSSGGVSIGNATDRGAGNLNVSGVVITGGYTVATLPTGVVGMRAYVTNALAPTYGMAVVGGGAVTIPVFYNGTTWIVA